MGLRTPGQQPAATNPPAAPPADPAELRHGDPYPDEPEDTGPEGSSVVIDDEPAGDPPAPAAPAPAAPAAPAAAPIVMDGRTFQTPQELATYTEALQKGFALGRTPAQIEKPPVLIDGKPLEQVMFNEPERYNEWVLEQAETRAVNRLTQVTSQERAVNNYWTDFYNKNPDLKPHEFIVKSKFNQTYPALEKLSVPDSMSQLAKEARGEVDNVRKSFGVTTTQLPTGGATTLGASGAPAPRVPQQTPKPKTFVDQLRDARRKRA